MIANKDRFTDREEFKKECIKQLGCSPRTIKDYLPQVWQTNKSKVGIYNKEQFLNKFDDESKVKEGIKKGIETISADEIIDDSLFRSERCKLTISPIFRNIANNIMYCNYQFRIGNKVFWCSPESKLWALKNISKAREL